jgi:O-antigen/teichoic acid export membrane protein
VPVLVTGIILYGIRSMLNMPLTKIKKPHLISYIAIGTGLLNVGLNFLIIPLLGSLGAALTTAASEGFAVIICLMINKKYDYTGYEIVKYFKAFFIGSGLIYIWLLVPEINIFLRLTLDLIIILLYPVLLALIGFFEPHELRRIKESFFKWSKISNIMAQIKKEYKSK